MLSQDCHSPEAEKFPGFSLTSGQFLLTLDQLGDDFFLFFSFLLLIVISSPFVCCKLVLGILM